ncbi:hypothetical protein [Ralstonia sp.]|uniref:hypothetical protein n=1 Tax=Ralstonia sp. TaxID=54061 RepID=UPI00397AA39F
MRPLVLQPRHPLTDPPPDLEDVLVFGRLGRDDDDDWHIAFRVPGRAGTWRLTDSSDDELTFTVVHAWCHIPGDPRPDADVRAVA